MVHLLVCFLTCAVTCSFHFRLFWIITSRYLYASTCFTEVLLMIIGALSFCVFLNQITFLLSVLRLDSDCFHYTMMKHRMECLYSCSLSLLLLPIITLSTAYLIILDVVEHRDRTLVQMINENADCTHPWGAPVFIEVQFWVSVQIIE